MNTNKTLLTLTLKGLAIFLLGIQANARSETAGLESLLADGKPIVNIRARIESVEQSELSDGNAYTIRTRLGFQTAQQKGFQALIEMEDITALDYNGYNAAGLNGQAGKAVVLDPKTTELNRAWLSFSSKEAGSLKLGRQLVTFDDHRFIGHVGWRQNIQTFDAVAYSGQASEAVAYNVAYLDEVHRILGDDHPAGDVDLEALLFNASYTGIESHKLTAFAYMIESSQLRGWSSDTFGIRSTGALETGSSDNKLNYAFSYATQSDNSSSPSGSSFSLDYYDLQAWTIISGLTVGAGLEVLEGNGSRGFSTPLATVHKFNGWADVFAGGSITGGLGSGLQDTYLKFAYKFATGKGLPVTIFYHWYEQENGSTDLGTEFNLVSSYKLSKHLTGILKFADYNGGGSSLADRRKFWLELNFNY